MIDLATLKARIDIIPLAAAITDLRKKTGNEYTGPCPFCGGVDRFNVQKARWLCRHCTDGKWHDVLSFIARRDGLDLKRDFSEIVKRTGEPFEIITRGPQGKPTQPAYSPPAQDWQQAAREIIEVTRRQLLGADGENARRYLTRRGLLPETVDRFGLGYSTGQEIAGLFVLRGIVIPCAIGGEVWYIKVRTNNPDPKWRYRQVKGSKSAALFNADVLAFDAPALFVEGEFDCMIADQEVGDSLNVATFGAAGYVPDLATWGAYLARPGVCLISYDLDEKGEAGAFNLARILGERAHLAPVPEGRGKDINAYFLESGDLWPWIRDVLAFFDPLPSGSAIDYARALA